MQISLYVFYIFNTRLFKYILIVYNIVNKIKTIALFFDGLDEKEMQVLKHWIGNLVEDRLAKEGVKCFL